MPMDNPTTTAEHGIDVWDKELNHAIQTLASDYPDVQEVPLAEYLDPGFHVWTFFQDNNRVPVPVSPEDAKTDTSIFGDKETLYQLENLITRGMLANPGTHAEHKPNICADMEVIGVQSVCDAIEAKYGSTEKTREWRKAIWLTSVGVVGFTIAAGKPPVHPGMFVRQGLEVFAGETPDYVKGYLVAQMRSAETQRSILRAMREGLAPDTEDDGPSFDEPVKTPTARGTKTRQ